MSGDIHATYSAGTVSTGRLSCSNPNMQQVTAALRPAFIPREGYVFADLDYSQIELRVAAFVSRCEPMIEAFRRGDDLHTLLAARITGKAPAAVLAGERKIAKAGNFGLLYGMGSYGFRAYAEQQYDVSFSQAEADAIHRTFFETWAGLAEWHARTIQRLHRTGEIVSPLGRVRRLPGVWDSNEGQVSFSERAAINSPVQGFASDLMQMAAASIEGALPGSQEVRGARIVATVHDSIVVEVPLADWRDVTMNCINRMVRVGDGLGQMDCVLDVPLAVEASVGTRWGLSDIGTLT
jgi:DNA polymerase-1